MCRTRFRLAVSAVVILFAALVTTSLRAQEPSAATGSATGKGASDRVQQPWPALTGVDQLPQVEPQEESPVAIHGHVLGRLDLQLGEGQFGAPPSDALDEVLYRDDFNGGNSNWPVVNSESEETAFRTGEYLWRIKIPRWISSRVVTNVSLDDVGLEAEVRVGSSVDPAAPGIVVQEPGSADRLVFVVQPLGGVYGLMRQNAQSSTWMIQPTSHTAILAAGKNRIRLEREGQALRLMVNGELLRTVSFPAGLVEGFGLAVWHGGQSGVADSYFDYVELESLDGIPPTRTPGPTPTPTARPTPGTGQEAFFDDFSDPTTGWPAESSDSHAYAYVEGEYRIFSRGMDRWVAAWNGPLLRDVSAEASVRIPDDAGAIAGLLFQVQDAEQAFFALIIRPDRNLFALARHTPAGWSLYVPWTSTRVIRAEGQANRLRVEQRGTIAHLTINDLPVGNLPIPRMTGQGGLYVENIDRPQGAEAYFDDFYIVGSTPPAGPLPSPTATAEYTYAMYRNTFDDPADSWCQLAAPSYRTQRRGGELHWWTLENNLVLCGLVSTQNRVDVRVDVRAHRSDYQKSFALLFGTTRDATHALLVNPSRQYFALARIRTSAPGLGLIHAGNSDAILPDGTNALRVVSDGELISVIVNEVLVAQVADIVPPGGFGLSAANGDDPNGSDIYFDNLVLLLPQRPVLTELVRLPPWPRVPIEAPTPIGPPRPTPTPRAQGARLKQAWLPVALRGVEGKDLPAPVPAAELRITFGRGVDSSGQLIRPGILFPADTRSLTGRVSYSRMPAGTVLRWEWRFDGQRIEDAALRGRHTTRDATGHFDVAIASNTEQALASGRYGLWVHSGSPRRSWMGEAHVEP